MNSKSEDADQGRLPDGLSSETTGMFSSSAYRTFRSIKATFTAFGAKVRLRTWVIETKRVPITNLQDVHMVLTTSTPEELASEILNDPCRFHIYTRKLVTHLRIRESAFDAIAAPEARGFMVGRVVAKELHKPFIPIRKARVDSAEPKFRFPYYYGDVVLTIPSGIKESQRIYFIDDDLLTGGTGVLSCKVIKLAGGKVVGIGVLIEWPQLKGRKKLQRKLPESDFFSALQAFA